MSRYETGTDAPYGLYVCSRPLDVTFVGSDGETLAGRPGARYLRLPTWMVIIAAPALGGAFVVAFPTLVIVAFFGLLASAIVKRLSGGRAPAGGSGGASTDSADSAAVSSAPPHSDATPDRD